MSFDIVFQPARRGTEPVEMRNPFTGEVQAVLPIEPLTTRDLDAVRDVLRGNSAIGPNEFGCHVVRLEDGEEVEVYAGDGLETGDGLDTSCMIAIHGGLSTDTLRFLLDLLKAADWVMLPVMEGNPAIVAIPGRAESLGGEYPEVVCGSVEELGVVLPEGYEGWRRYRDHVLG